MKHIIYIAGPITGTEDYLDRFKAAEKKLKKLYPEAQIVNPAEICRTMPEMPRHEYIEITLRVLHYCTDIYMLRKWMHSDGAIKEYQVAGDLNLEILEET